jgi:hypothetical protein
MSEVAFSPKLKVWKEKDVVVVGGGPAGCLAALAAGRNGADTLLIERQSCLGGMMTGGFVNLLTALVMMDAVTGGPAVVKGISLEVFKRLQGAGGTYPWGPDVEHEQRMEPAIMVRVLDQMMEESNVEVLFNTFAFDAIVKDHAVKGLAIANKSGGQVVSADVVVDASGDADIAAAAGAPFMGDLHKARAGFHGAGGSLLMEVGGISFDRFLDYLKKRPKTTEQESRRLEEEVEKRRKEGKCIRFPKGIDEEWLEYVKSREEKGEEVPHQVGFPERRFPVAPMMGIGGFGEMRNGKVRYDQVMTGAREVWFDQTNQEEISKALVYMRKLNDIYIKFLRERIPGFEDAYIIQESPTVGTRGSRLIAGEYTLTEEDCFNAVRFPDVIAKCGRAQSFSLKPKKPYDIPYRCLVPQKIDNLLVAGRCISVTPVVHNGIRGQGPCMSTGEAAGTAAALSSRLNVPPRKLDVRLLQRKLLEQGVLLFLEEEKETEKDVRAYQTTPP